MQKTDKNSNLVIVPERSREKNVPTGEPETLRGKSLYSFGDKAERERAPEKKESRKKRPATSGATSAAPGSILRNDKAKRRAEITAVSSEFIDPTLYKPKTEDTRIAFEKLLTFVKVKLGDQPQDILRGATDVVLSLLKDDGLNDSQKKKEIESVIGNVPITSVELNSILNVSKQITDYSAQAEQDQEAMQIEDAEEHLGNSTVAPRDADVAVGVVFDEEEEEENEDEFADIMPGEEEAGEEEEGEDTEQLDALKVREAYEIYQASKRPF